MFVAILFFLIGMAFQIWALLVPDFHIFPAFFQAIESFVASLWLYNSVFDVSALIFCFKFWIDLELSLLALSFAFWVLNAIVGLKSHTGDHL